MKARTVIITFPNSEDAAWFMLYARKQMDAKQGRVSGHAIGTLLDSLGSASVVTSPDLTEAQAERLRQGRQIE